MNVKVMALERALATLRALGAQYIIKMADESMHAHGELKLALPEPPKRNKVPRTYTHNYYRPLVEPMQVGDCVVVPWTDNATHESLQSAVTAWCSNHWGNGSYISSQSEQGLEVLRLS